MPSQSLKPAADRINDFSSIIQFARHNTPAWLGLSLLFLWTWSYFQNSFIYSETRHLTSVPISMPWAIVALSFVIVFFAMGFVSRRVDFNFQNKTLLSVVALTMFLAPLAISHGQSLSSASGTLLFLCGLITLGAATPILYIEVIRVFLNFSFKMILFSSTLATVFAVSFYTLLSVLTPRTGLLFTLCIPPLILTCLLTSFRRYGAIEQIPCAVEGPTYIPWRLLLTSLFQGIAYSMAQTYLIERLTINKTSLDIQTLFCLFGFLAAAISMLVVIIFFRPDFDSLIYKIGFVFLSVGLLSISITQFQSLGMFLNSFGHRFIDCLIWALVIYLTQSKRVSLNWIAAWPTAALYLGMSFGFILTTNTSKDLMGLSTEQILSILAVGVLAAAIAFTSSRNIVNGWGSIRITEGFLNREFSPQALEIVQTRYNLSPRQQDVFILMCRGLARREIANELYLSEETVKVHIHNIYQKASVHSRHDLLGIIEAEDRLLRK